MELLHTRVYEDFGGLDVHCVSADSTNDHLDAAYEPLSQNADDFEAQVKPFIRQICALAGFDNAMPAFNRSKDHQHGRTGQHGDFRGRHHRAGHGH